MQKCRKIHDFNVDFFFKFLRRPSPDSTPQRSCALRASLGTFGGTWTFRTLDYSYPGLFVQSLDNSYHVTRLSKVNTRTMDVSYQNVTARPTCTRSDEFQRTTNSLRPLCETFMDAYSRLNLLEDDSEWRECYTDAVHVRTACTACRSNPTLSAVCQLSAVLWTADPASLFEQFTADMAKDFVHRQMVIVQNKVLLSTETLVSAHGRSLSDFNLPIPVRVIHYSSSSSS